MSTLPPPIPATPGSRAVLELMESLILGPHHHKLSSGLFTVHILQKGCGQSSLLDVPPILLDERFPTPSQVH